MDKPIFIGTGKTDPKCLKEKKILPIRDEFAGYELKLTF
jgi:hypothetical protein